MAVEYIAQTWSPEQVDRSTYLSILRSRDRTTEWSGWTEAGRTTCENGGGWAGPYVDLYLKYKLTAANDNSGHYVELFLCAYSTDATKMGAYNYNEDSANTCTLTIGNATSGPITINHDFGYDSTTGIKLENIFPQGPYFQNASNTQKYFLETPYKVFVKHNEETTVTISGSIKVKNEALKGGSTSAIITLPALTTACTAPTKVSASGLVKPSGSFQVSWEGAGAGVANAISGYRIYYRLSNNGAAPTTSTYTGYVDVDSKIASTTISLSNATRGYKVVCGVVTKGAAGSDWWSGIKTGGLVTINSLPTAPLVTVSSAIFPSTGSGSFSATQGTDIDGQTCSVYYATSVDGTKTLYTKSLSVTNTTTYYFWTWDGLEYSSSYTAKTITKNIKPEITEQVITPTVYTSNGASYTSGLSINYTLNKNSGTITTYIIIGSTIAKTITTTAASSSTTIKLNINEYLKDHYKNAVLSYGVYSVFNDGLEDSEQSAVSTYNISAPPAITKWENGIGEQNAYFGTKLIIYYNEDTEISSRLIKTNKGQISNPVYGNTSISFNLINNPGGGAVTFTLEFGNGQFIKTSTVTINQIEPIKLENETINPTFLNYFSEELESAILSCKWPFVGDVGEKHGFNGLTRSNISAVITYGNKIKTVTDHSVFREGDYLRVSIPIRDLKVFDSSLSETFAGEHIFNVKIRATNKFGDNIDSNNCPVTISYNIAPTWNSFISNCNNSNKIQEGKELSFTLNFKTNTQENVRAYIYIDRTGSIQEANRDWVIYKEFDFTGLNYGPTPDNNIKTLSFSIPEITDSNNRAFKCRLVGQASGLVAESPSLSIPVLRHTSPTIFLFKKVVPTKTGGTVEYELGDPGYKEGEGSSILKITNAYTDGYNIVNNSWDGELESTVYQLVLITQVNGREKTFYSNTLLYFSEVPTVSYRKNLIGINFKEIDSKDSENSLIMISQYDQKKYLTFYGYTESGEPIERTLDLSTGKFSNFTIDCGSW